MSMHDADSWASHWPIGVLAGGTGLPRSKQGLLTREDAGARKRLSRRGATGGAVDCWLQVHGGKLACGSNNDDVWSAWGPLREILSSIGNVEARLASWSIVSPRRTRHASRGNSPVWQGAARCGRSRAGAVDPAPLRQRDWGQAACVVPTSKARRRIQGV
ncbi:hypothetical protein BU16DRAFT_597728 [Lophium mytilinum]|uniref:Uncharacterized protein n=1 Tax=Lophium mytilinum TaxID=390894 RepID=A0A6A6QCH5_9PEZI|nr:hypothetical protein BU16DRAFT_597728 [Lophium mytilinum]